MAYSSSAILFIIGVEKCWDQELSQICHSARAYVLIILCLCASENQVLRARGNIQFLELAVKLAVCFVSLKLLGSIKWQVNHSLDSSCKTMVTNFDSVLGIYFN